MISVKLVGTNPLIVLIVVVMFLSFAIPVVEMLYKTFKPPKKQNFYKKQQQQRQNQHDYGNSRDQEASKEPVSKPSYFLYREKDLLKMKMKDLKTILWGKSIPYADLSEKREFVKRAMERVRKDLKRMQKKELKSLLRKENIEYDRSASYEHLDLINLYLES